MKPLYSEQLRRYIQRATDGQESIPAERRDLIAKIASQINVIAEEESAPSLIFVCTHNSRRSHFAHIWCAVALSHFGKSAFSCGSGGTEVTACNERTIEALRRSGLNITKSNDAENPVYQVAYCEEFEPIQCFSKIYNQPPNPETGFVALLCCSDVDERCPVIAGARARFSLHYEDPKKSDGTDAEQATYDERCLQIASQMFCLAEMLSHC